MGSLPDHAAVTATTWGPVSTISLKQRQKKAVILNKTAGRGGYSALCLLSGEDSVLIPPRITPQNPKNLNPNISNPQGLLGGFPVLLPALYTFSLICNLPGAGTVFQHGCKVLGIHGRGADNNIVQGQDLCSCSRENPITPRSVDSI